LVGPYIGQFCNARLVRQEGAECRQQARLRREHVFERLRGGAEGLRPERLEAGTLLQETVARFAPTASAADIELAGVPADSSGPADLSFVADRQAIERILGNLVANALAAVSSGGHVWLAARPVALNTIALGDPEGDSDWLTANSVRFIKKLADVSGGEFTHQAPGK
jgi:signal transduction histidine kinase